MDDVFKFHSQLWDKWLLAFRMGEPLSVKMCDVETEEKMVLSESITEKGTPPTCCTVETKEEDRHGSHSVEVQVTRTCFVLIIRCCLLAWLYPPFFMLFINI